ncbi:winged helix-turn-helix transcriptional regulator [Marinicrinis sediminis]|uniref:Winged helix-turn-helix transcriptional regulator n=1 Tax=Marinicrinis sediminis TaxID=1652465 RepID=A0ABW5R9F8_9BACL
MLEHNGKKFVCHIDWGMELVRGKWKSVILCHLSDGPKRFLELQRITSGVSQKVLTQKLNEMEQHGLILKKTYPEVPPRVEYELTELGKELFPALQLLESWSIKYFDQVTQESVKP